MDIGIATVGPIDEVGHRLQQGLAQRGQTIFDARRLGWKDMAGDQSVALQIAQGLGQHALGDVADCAVKLAEALWSRRQGHDHEDAPLVADAVEHVAHGATYGPSGLGGVRLISAESLDCARCSAHAGSPRSLLVTKNCLLAAQFVGLYLRPAPEYRPYRARRKHMFLVMGITGKVG